MSAGVRLPKGIQMKEGLKMNRSSLEMTVTSTSSSGGVPLVVEKRRTRLGPDAMRRQ
jgi:hypothetical protein